MEGKQKVALITGVTGMDGATLATLLLEKNYIVHGVKRRTSLINTDRIDSVFNNKDFHLHYGDMTDGASLFRLIQETKPDEIYNLAAMSHVQVSFEIPEYTTDVIATGTVRLLEAIRNSGRMNEIKYYQASSSEMYGKVQEVPQTETTAFYPRSPYGVAKTFGYWITKNYREAYNMFACNGILFNHEGPTRGETFVTRKITRAIGRGEVIRLGNLDAQRDWGHTRDYMEAAWLMLQQDTPDDYVIATGITTTVRDFCKMAFKEVGINLKFIGSGLDEIGIDSEDGTVLVKVDPVYFRPTEVDLLIGDSTKARKILGWKPKYDLKAIIKEMIQVDIKWKKIVKSSSQEDTEW